VFWLALELEDSDWAAQIEQEKERIVEEIAEQLSRDNPGLFSSSLGGDSYANVERIVRSAVLTRQDLMPGEIDGVATAIMGQASGYGPLLEFFVGADAQEITEVLVNPTIDGPVVFYGKNGRHWPAGGMCFKDNEEVSRYCQKVCEDIGRPFTTDSPMVDAWLKDGSRIAVMGYKVSPLGAAITIRKSPLVRPPLPLSKLVEFGTLPKLTADLLVDVLVKGHANLGIFGRTDSGKTAFLRALGQHIDPIERVIIGETSYELSFPNLKNCINLTEVVYGSNKIVNMTQICEAINRNNPDRALVGEVRGGEIVAAAEIAESTSGGFWTTGHAGGVNELRSRIPKMFARGGMSLAREYVDEQIRCMFHFLIFLDKDSTGQRLLISLVEVTDEGYRTIVRFDEDEFARTGKRRWLQENAITNARLSRLAFRGAEIRPEYETAGSMPLYPEDEQSCIPHSFGPGDSPDAEEGRN
jgi:pilus assembly protein CpaF